MNRYQIYLNPYSVGILDRAEEITNISRSKFIRETLDRVAQMMVDTFFVPKINRGNYKILNSLNGIIDLKKRKKVNLASKEDIVYLKE